MKPWLASLLVAAAATAAVLASLGPQAGGPGATCDELYHVGLAGKPLVTAVRQQGLAFFRPENVRRNFAWPAGGPPVQAPLGHWILGLTHHLFDPAPDNPAVVSLGAARLAPAVAFGLLVFLVGQWTRRRAGPVAGTVAALGVVLMPRLFAHARFAALDMLTTVSCVAALFAVTWAARPVVESPVPNRLAGWGRFALAGVVWGAAMLIRLHGVLLLPPVALWLLWRSGYFSLLWQAAAKLFPPRRLGVPARQPQGTMGVPARRSQGRMGVPARRSQGRMGVPARQPATDKNVHPTAARPPARRAVAVAPLAWFAAGVATLALGWPWLWLNPVENLGRYLASGADRHAVHVFYLGRVWADHQAPWHYPLLMSLWTVPAGFLLLGAAGAAAWWGSVRESESAPPQPSNMPRGRMDVPARRRKTDKNVHPTADMDKKVHPASTTDKNVHPTASTDKNFHPASTTDKNVHPTANTERNVDHGGGASSATGAEGDFALLALAGTFLLAVFAWPGVPVYDGVRLFLVVFPLWAVFAGLGAGWLVVGPVLRRLAYRTRVGGIGLLVASQAAGLLLYHPCQTSYYNVLVGGLWGAERLGLETTYWGDSVVEPMLAEAARRAPGRAVLFGPHLAPFQAPGVEMASASLAEAETTLVGWDPGRPERAAACRYAVIYRRRADLAPIDWVLRHGQVVAEYRKQGIWLTRLVRLPSGPPPRRAEPGD